MGGKHWSFWDTLVGWFAMSVCFSLDIYYFLGQYSVGFVCKLITSFLIVSSCFSLHDGIGEFSSCFLCKLFPICIFILSYDCLFFFFQKIKDNK